VIGITSRDEPACSEFGRGGREGLAWWGRRTLATYSGLFDAVRRLSAQTDETRAHGQGPSRASVNVAEGACETCAGESSVSVELLFLPGTYAACPALRRRGRYPR
jgi:excinuclease UvrABC ATPase subunit